MVLYVFSSIDANIPIRGSLINRYSKLVTNGWNGFGACFWDKPYESMELYYNP
jgi:hypothetical protein